MHESVPEYGYICLACLYAERYGSLDAWLDELADSGDIDLELEAALIDVYRCELRALLGIR